MGCGHPGTPAVSTAMIMLVVIRILSIYNIDIYIIISYIIVKYLLRMRIQYFLLLSLATVLLVQLNRIINSEEQFVNTQCIVGEINQTQLTKNVIDCVSCLSFPFHTFKKGKITIRNGDPQKIISDNSTLISEIYGFAYMQKTCVQFQCQDLQSSEMFVDNKILHQAGFTLYKQILTKKSHQLWQIIVQYNNRITVQKSATNIKRNIINYLLAPILPFSLLSQIYYQGFALKIRFSQQLHKNIQQIQKPVIKISNHAQTTSDLVILTIIIAFTLAIKLSFFTQNRNIQIKYILLSFGFISPYLWSIFCLIVMARRHPQHFASLLIFISGISFGTDYLTFISVALSSFIQYEQDSKIANKKLLLIFNLIIFFALYFQIQSILSMSINLLYAFCCQANLDYKQINSKDTNKHSISLQQIDQTHLQDHH